MTKYHIACASEEFAYVWQYRSMVSSSDLKGTIGTALLRKEGKEKLFHIDELASSDSGKLDFKRPAK